MSIQRLGTGLIRHEGTTLDIKLDEMDSDILSLENADSAISARIDPLYKDINKIYESSEPNKKYAAFCDCCMVLGKETFIHRVSSQHTADGGGKSSLHISQKENGVITTKYIIQPVAGYDFRDPSIMFDPVSRRVVVSVQNFNAAAGTYNGGSIYVFSASLAIQNQVTVGAAGYFQWGKVLRTPDGKMLVAAYDTTANKGVALFTSTGSFDTPTSFTQTGTLFNDDNTLSRTEVSLHYWKEFLVAVARTQDVATQSLQAASYAYTRDLSGAGGWTGGRLNAYTTVAPRMTTMPDGGLVITAGSIFSGKRGSVASILTYDLLVFSSANTIFQGTVGDGGYHGTMLTEKGMAIYTYMESTAQLLSSTYLQYVDLSVVQVLGKPTSAPLSFLASNNVTYLGDVPFGTSPTTADGYITFYLKENINNCRGIVANFGGSMSSAQAVLLQRPDGTTYATLGGLNVSAVGTYYASHAGVNLPAGKYRLKLPTGYVCTGVRKNSSVLTYDEDRVYGLVDINGVVATAGQDVFLGFAV